MAMTGTTCLLLMCNYQVLWRGYSEHLLLTYRSDQVSVLSLTQLKVHENYILILWH